MLNLEDDDIAVIYQAIYKPGGKITRRNTRLPNPGTPVSALFEKMLKLVRFMLQHYVQQLHCTLTPNLIANEN